MPLGPDTSGNSEASRERLQQALGEAYRLERELGRGGMATVYLAHDRKHDRPVALKVLLPDLGAALGPERFQREVRVAARLQHPHILPVFDSGDAGGRLWYTMPYVAGETLRDRLTRERQLPVDDAVRIVREAAQGLHYAHQQRVIHRDVKPENILLTEDGTTLVADFGIARAIAGETGTGVGGATHLTGTGLAIGTPAYMSPEQAAGDSGLDARSDVYSLGAVLYELLAGEPPFTGPTPQAILAKRFATPAPSVRVVRPGVPVELEAVLARALATAPADRFGTAGEFSVALGAALSSSSAATALGAADAKGARRQWRVLIPIAAILIALVGTGAWWLRGRTSTAASAIPNQASLAVLPFDNLGDSADAYFAEGVSDEVRGKLAGLQQLRVIASASSRQYTRTTKSPGAIARELGVRYLLVGRVRWQKQAGGHSRVRVDPELVDVTGGAAPATTWQQPFDAELSDVFRVQSEIAERVVGQLRVALQAGERRELTNVPTRSLDAYDAYLRGQNMLATVGSGPAELKTATAAFREAVDRDSTFVRAWVRLVTSYVNMYVSGGPRSYAVDSARIALEHAHALAPNLPEVVAARAVFEYGANHEYERAYQIAAKALAQWPNNYDVLNISATAEMHLGRWSDAARHYRQAQQLDPRSVQMANAIGVVERIQRHTEAARAAFDQALALQPGRVDLRVSRALVELDAGDLAGARKILQATPPSADLTPLLVEAAWWDVVWMLDEQMRRRFFELRPSAFGGNRGWWAISLADAYAARGDSAKARAYGDSAHLGVQPRLAEIPVDPQDVAVDALALAYAGRKAEALAAAERAPELARLANYPAGLTVISENRLRVFLIFGDRERALAEVEAMQAGKRPHTPGWLRVDPHFAALRGEPRFERLAAAR